MSNVTRLPATDLPFKPGDDPRSLPGLVKHEPRGGPIDHAAIVKDAMNVPPLPGASEANEREAYRTRLVAGIRGMGGQVVNNAAGGAVAGAATGLALAAGVVALLWSSRTPSPPSRRRRGRSGPGGRSS
jgi:hypothetical protein